VSMTSMDISKDKACNGQGNVACIHREKLTEQTRACLVCEASRSARPSRCALTNSLPAGDCPYLTCNETYSRQLSVKNMYICLQNLQNFKPDPRLILDLF